MVIGPSIGELANLVADMFINDIAGSTILAGVLGVSAFLFLAFTLRVGFEAIALLGLGLLIVLSTSAFLPSAVLMSAWFVIALLVFAVLAKWIL